MLLQFTLRCHEECSHCLVSAGKERNEFIEDRTIVRVIKYLKKMGTLPVLITGGEFTLHPKWWEFVKKLAKETDNFYLLLSNGTWIGDKDKEDKVQNILSLPNVVGMQVSSFRKFYKSYDRIESMQHEFPKISKKIGVVLGEEPTSMTPLGRAKGMTPRGKSFTPCVNIFLLSAQLQSWKDVHTHLAAANKWCVPTIDTEGIIHAGETHECRAIGTVDDSPVVLFRKLQGCRPCGDCGLPVLEVKGKSREEIAAGIVSSSRIVHCGRA